MEVQSLQSRLLDWMKGQREWVSSGRVEDTARAWGYMGSTATRKARLLAEEGKLICRLNEKGQAEYTAKNDNPARPSLNRIFQNKMF